VSTLGLHNYWNRHGHSYFIFRNHNLSADNHWHFIAREWQSQNGRREVNATYVLRGIRYVNDFEYEKAIADMNRSLDENIETVFLTCLPKYTSVASTLVRDVIRNGGDVSQFVPDAVLKTIRQNNKSMYLA